MADGRTPDGMQLPELQVGLSFALPGERARELIEQLAQAECPALTQRRARRAEATGAASDPIVWTRALGCNVWDADDNRFVDMSAGFGAAAVGHAHPRVVRAITEQSARLLHALGDLHPSDVKVALLSKLRSLGPFEDGCVMLGQNGGDAVTAALKTAALFTGKPGVLAFEGGYHGLDYGPLAACGYGQAMREPFEAQLNPHVAFAPYPRGERDLDAALESVERLLSSQPELGLVLVEPLQGRGGVIVPPRGFLPGLRAACDRHGVLLAIDEIMTGLGRTGALLACVAQGVRPDLLCLGKALGGGMPVSACLGERTVMAAWGDPGREALHTGTFFGHPVGCAAALAALAVIEDEQLCARAAAAGERLRAALASRLSGQPSVVEVRGEGLLVGIELLGAGRALALGRALLERGYITVPAASDASVVSLTPPLGISDALLDAFVDATHEALGVS
jgi:4-aminobutyrate aminotransferase/(S)-3-amino-2-methylpropionate transaminase